MFVLVYFKKNILAIIALLLILLSVIWYFLPPYKIIQPRTPDILTIETVTVKQETFSAWLGVMATVIDHRDSVVESPLTSKVINVFVKEGDAVKKGDKLIELDHDDLTRDKQLLTVRKQQIADAIKATQQQIKNQTLLVSKQEAIQRLTEKKYERYQELLKEKLISVQQIESLNKEALNSENQLIREKSTLLDLKKDLALIEVSLQDVQNQMKDIDSDINDCMIRAQWDGWVRGLKVNLDSQVAINENILTLQGNNYDLKAPLSIARYKKLMMLETIDAYLTHQGQRIDLKQGKIAPRKLQRQPEVIWALPDDQAWVSGEQYNAYVKIPHDQRTMRIPKKALFDSYVYEVKDGRLSAVPVSVIDISDEGDSNVLVTGLVDGMQIMISGVAGPKEGLAVRAIP